MICVIPPGCVLRELAPAHAEVLILRFYEDMELEMIADILRLPVGIVKSRLHYALKRLRCLSQARVAEQRAGGGLMSRKLQRMYVEAGLPNVDEQTATYLELGLENERVPQPRAAETSHLQAVLSEHMATAQPLRYRKLVERAPFG